MFKKIELSPNHIVSFLSIRRNDPHPSYVMSSKSASRRDFNPGVYIFPSFAAYSKFTVFAHKFARSLLGYRLRVKFYYNFVYNFLFCFVFPPITQCKVQHELAVLVCSKNYLSSALASLLSFFSQICFDKK